MPDHAHRHDPCWVQSRLKAHGRCRGGSDIDDLLVAVGCGDLQALAVLYDTTAPVVFGLLHAVLGHRFRAEQATERVYLHLWGIAPAWEPTKRCAYSLLLHTTGRELTGQVEHHLRTHEQAETDTDDRREPAHPDER